MQVRNAVVAHRDADGELAVHGFWQLAALLRHARNCSEQPRLDDADVLSALRSLSHKPVAVHFLILFQCSVSCSFHAKLLHQTPHPRSNRFAACLSFRAARTRPHPPGAVSQVEYLHAQSSAIIRRGSSPLAISAFLSQVAMWPLRFNFVPISGNTPPRRLPGRPFARSLGPV